MAAILEVSEMVKYLRDIKLTFRRSFILSAHWPSISASYSRAFSFPLLNLGQCFKYIGPLSKPQESYAAGTPLISVVELIDFWSIVVVAGRYISLCNYATFIRVMGDTCTLTRYHLLSIVIGIL
jgi:hypothetical protein